MNCFVALIAMLLVAAFYKNGGGGNGKFLMVVFGPRFARDAVEESAKD
jgi:hypothetical protein